MHSGCYDRCFVENLCANEEVVFMNFPYISDVAAFLLYLIISSFIIIAIVFDFKK